MNRLISYFAIAAALVVGSPPADAAKVAALIIGNSAPEQGLGSIELGKALDQLKHGIFRYESDDTLIVDGIDLDRAALIDRLKSFERELARADVALVYYVGAGVHTHDDSFLVPAGVTGSDLNQLVSVQEILGTMNALVGGRGLVFLDGVSPPAAVLSETVRPGFAKLDRSSGEGRLAITYASAPEQQSWSETESLTKALIGRLNGDVLPLTKLAALLQQDVSFVSDGVVRPRVVSGVLDVPELRSVAGSDLRAKVSRCVSLRDGGAEGVKVASADPAAGIELSSHVDSFFEKGKTRAYPWYCPLLPPEEQEDAPKASRPSEKSPDAKAVIAPPGPQKSRNVERASASSPKMAAPKMAAPKKTAQVMKSAPSRSRPTSSAASGNYIPSN